MTTSITLPPQVAWASGAFANGPLIKKTTLLQDLAGVFADTEAWQQQTEKKIAYQVEMLDTPTGDGELYVGVTHLQPGKVGNEFFMTRGHFHARREQGEIYFGLRGTGLLLLQSLQGEVKIESVFAGSVHIIAGNTAHRLINTGSDILSALAVWPSVAGHDYTALARGFSRRVIEENGSVQIKEVAHG